MDTSTPHLDYRDEFVAALATLTVSERAKQALSQTNFVVLMGVAGSGRNTIINELVKTDLYKFVVSDTTREPKFRNGRLEQNGVEYFFRDEKDMLEDIKNGEFIEAELIHNQQVSGVSIRALEEAAENEKIPITDIEYKGANVIANAMPSARVIALLPPNYEIWLARINGRELMPRDEFLNRLRTAKSVLESILANTKFKIIINDTVEGAVRDIRGIVEDNDYNDEMYAAGRRVAEELLTRVNETLATTN
jgi:guanylate kinase